MRKIRSQKSLEIAGGIRRQVIGRRSNSKIGFQSRSLLNGDLRLLPFSRSKRERGFWNVRRLQKRKEGNFWCGLGGGFFFFAPNPINGSIGGQGRVLCGPNFNH